MRTVERRAVRRGIATACALALIGGAGAALAQFPVPGPPRERAPLPIFTVVEGTVIKVDVAESRLQLAAGLFGNVGQTLEVAMDTVIEVRGRPGPLSDVQEGDHVKASYEVRNGANIARVIRVTPQLRQGASRSRLP